MRVLAAVLWKDLVSEWRSRERVVAMLVFSLLVVVVFHFALPGGATARNASQAPGLLWVAYVFAALLGLNRAFSIELENDAISVLALAPVDRGWVFLGKFLANFLILGAVQIVVAVVFAVFFQLDFSGIVPQFAGIVALGSAGLCSVGTFFSAMAVRTRFREVMLPLLMIPPLLPVLAAAVEATVGLFTEGKVPPGSLQLLLVADGIYCIASFILFDYVLDG
ncbi:heme exporter protein CcmB [Myxococcota bacterium]|nr:heme exporter protein CcmB [Myxococcota bacterium]